MTIPRAPKGLKTAGRRLWTSVLTDYWMDSESHKLALLEQACRVSDRIAELQEAMDGLPLTVPGPGRQIQIHPILDQIRHQQGLFVSLIRSLGLPDGDEDEQEAERRERRSQQARNAANTRWKNR